MAFVLQWNDLQQRLYTDTKGIERDPRLRKQTVQRAHAALHIYFKT